MEQGTVRNLEQIQEQDGEGRTPRHVTLLLVALGGACIVFAGLAVGGRRSVPSAQKADPLGELVSKQAKIAQGAKATDLSTRDVTFPGILSDESAPTTALAAVKGHAPPKSAGARGAGAEPSTKGANGAFATNGAPPAERSTARPGAKDSDDDAPAVALNVRSADIGGTERLSVVPLPAQNMLAASPVVTRPRDSLTRAAAGAAESAEAGQTPAAAGREGGYQLQVSSFRTQGEADAFSGQLRARGHKAYVVEAHVPGRGTWYRVRIGPFPSQQAASSYRASFEGREHVVPFIVQPSK